MKKPFEEPFNLDFDSLSEFEKANIIFWAEAIKSKIREDIDINKDFYVGAQTILAFLLNVNSGNPSREHRDHINALVTSVGLGLEKIWADKNPVAKEEFEMEEIELDE